MSRVACLSILLASALAASGARAEPSEPVSIHRLESEQHAGELPPPRVMPERLPEPRSESLSHAVYGYYPFWVADLSTIRWSALTHLAWFSIDMNSAGGVESAHGWPDEEVVSVAHAAGVRVHLSAVLFGGADIEALCTSPARRATAIDNMVTQMEAGGADGISVDFEFVNAATGQVFLTFLSELRAELDARGHGDAEISVAGPAVDWAGALDLDALLDIVDWFFIMGYDYFWSGSGHAGPSGMLRVTEDWAPFQSRSILRSTADYSRLIAADKRRQIILGVPYYGRQWATVSGSLGAATLSDEGAVTYSVAKADLAAGFAEALFHDGVASPWYRWQEGSTWHQVYYEDVASLEAKYELARAQDLGGVGMWALNYDKPHAELWDLLEYTFGPAMPGHPEGHRLAPIEIDSLPFHDERDTSEGASHYFNFYGCDPEMPEFGREWVYALDVCQPGTVLASVPEYPDRDPDLHLLDAPDQDACLARAHTDLEANVEPGRYLLVVDTYVDMPVEREGPYQLDVDFVPEPGTEGCASHLRCDAGDCVCPDPGQSECGDACVDLSSDDAHCGSCGHACGEGETCSGGQCESDGEGVGPSGVVVSATGELGCSCRAAPSRPSRGMWLGLAVSVVLLRRRARRSRMGDNGGLSSAALAG